MCFSPCYKSLSPIQNYAKGVVRNLVQWLTVEDKLFKSIMDSIYGKYDLAKAASVAGSPAMTEHLAVTRAEDAYKQMGGLTKVPCLRTQYTQWKIDQS